MASVGESVEEGKHEEGTPFEQPGRATKVAAIDESADESKSEEEEPGALKEGDERAPQFRQASGSEGMRVVEEGDTEDGDADDEIEEDEPAEDPKEKAEREAKEVAAHALAEQEAQRVAHAKAVADAQAQTVKERKLKEMKVNALEKKREEEERTDVTVSGHDAVRCAARIRQEKGSSGVTVRASGGGSGSGAISVADKGGASTVYHLDACFEPEATNAQVYTQLVQPMVLQCANEGFDTVVLLGGPSMASKAHTLHGAAGEEGIFGLAMADIFAKREVEDLVTVAVYQLRSGGGLDLLNPEPRASLNTTQIGGRVGMRGVAEIVCRSKEEARELVAEGIAISHIMSARHKLKNPCTLLEVSVTAGRHPDTRESMLRFVLLADCDGADEELQNLHQCIRLLVAPDANVPYNDSVLCRLLEPALRGQALLCYLALVVDGGANSAQDAEWPLEEAQGLRTLQERVKPKAKSVSVRMSRLRDDVERLRCQLELRGDADNFATSDPVSLIQLKRKLEELNLIKANTVATKHHASEAMRRLRVPNMQLLGMPISESGAALPARTYPGASGLAISKLLEAFAAGAENVGSLDGFSGPDLEELGATIETVIVADTQAITDGKATLAEAVTAFRKACAALAMQAAISRDQSNGAAVTSNRRKAPASAAGENTPVYVPAMLDWSAQELMGEVTKDAGLATLLRAVQALKIKQYQQQLKLNRNTNCFLALLMELERRQDMSKQHDNMLSLEARLTIQRETERHDELNTDQRKIRTKLRGSTVAQTALAAATDQIGKVLQSQQQRISKGKKASELQVVATEIFEAHHKVKTAKLRMQYQVDDLNGLLQVRAVRREWQMARKQQHFLTMFKQYRSHFDQEMIRASARYEEATKDSVWTATHLIKTHVMLADSITQEEEEEQHFLAPPSLSSPRVPSVGEELSKRLFRQAQGQSIRALTKNVTLKFRNLSQAGEGSDSPS